ncbi:transferase [Streptomyces sp. NPDC085946]|uniref:transferase n=1 Tax=Streptomyces sp. NPDC085946 TaxID=3365744 RepID=UPI0037CE8A28
MTTSPRDGFDPRLHCTADPDGRITFRLRPPPDATRPRLLLRLRPGKGQPETTLLPLDLEATGDGPWQAVLAPRPALAEGRWDVYLLRDPDAARERLRPGLRDLRALVDGDRLDRPSPVAVRIPYATKDGFLALRAWLRTVHAEAGRIDVTDRATTVTARLHGAALGDGASVRLRLRGSGGVEHGVRPVPDADHRGFRFTVGHEDLLRAGTAADHVWDVFVRPAADAPPVRVGRLLDDLADRKAVFVCPAARAGGAVLRPYYTVDNDLAVQVTRPG